MKRLPVIMICSRETNRLPTAEVQKLLGCSDGLQINPGNPSYTPNMKFVVYLREYDGQGDQLGERLTWFTLAEVGDKYEEKILDEGEVTGSVSHHAGGHYYSGFRITGKKLENYKFYVSYFGKN